MRAARRVLGTRALVGVLFFMVAGGPYGLEELYAKAGLGLSIVVLLVTPIVWSLPTALLVGELGSAIPEEGGFYAWVKRAMGPFFGFQEAWLSFAASVFDMAIYPTIFASYLGRFFPIFAEGKWSIAAKAAVLAAATIANLRGSKSVGRASFLMTVALLLPFVVLAVILVTRGPGDAPVEHAPRIGGDLLGGILIAMWNYMGWDNASTVAAEVDDPQRTYPRAGVFAVLLVSMSYVIPTLALYAAHIDVREWDTGAWANLGGGAAGRVLRGAMVVGGMVCGFGMLNALVLSYSRLPVALAEDGYLPAILAKRNDKTDAPAAAIVVSALAWTLGLGVSFDRLVSLDILLYGSSLTLEFAALVVLRIRQPDLPRPYRVPGGLPGAVLLGVAPVILLVIALVKNADGELFGVNALVIGVGVILVGPLLYYATRNRFGTPT